MATPDGIATRINGITRHLLQTGLARNYQPAFARRERDGFVRVSFGKSSAVSIALKDHNYIDIYRHLTEIRAYNMMMLDGALVQFMYEFRHKELLRHRLAFFPAPLLEGFQNDPDMYLRDETFGHIIARRMVPFPFRFDYDASAKRHLLRVHPKSHLTLGQYKDCRIPVSGPLTPFWFMDFILRNLYDTADKSYSEGLPRDRIKLGESIHEAERALVHVVVPT